MKSIITFALIVFIPLIALAQEPPFAAGNSTADNIEMLKYMARENKREIADIKKIEPRVLTLENSFVHIRNDLQDIKADMKSLLEKQGASTLNINELIGYALLLIFGGGAALGGKAGISKIKQKCGGVE